MKKKNSSKSLPEIRKNAAGIDVGAKSHFVAVPASACEKNVREFSSFTDDLHKMAKWLKSCSIDTVAIESTGSYWIPLYELLESYNIEVYLVNAKHIKNVPGRKTDVQDCQWIQQLHTYGLLQKSFRPDQLMTGLRSFIRQRTRMIEDAATHILRMQKALTEMNIQLNNVIRDVTGVTGMKIIRAIIAGERDVKKLASFRDSRCKRSVEEIQKSLKGNYKGEHIFALKQSVEFYDFYCTKIKECDTEIEEKLKQLETESKKPDDINKSKKLPTSEKNRYEPTKPLPKKLRKNNFSFDVKTYLNNLLGVDLTAIPGISDSSALVIVSEIGTNITDWKNSKHFASWLGLCPKNKISGGRILSSRTRPGSKRVSQILRLCASTLHNSYNALGSHLRRLKSRMGPAKAITAMAHKLAKMLYNMLRYGTEYVEEGQEKYEERYKKRSINSLERMAKRLGYGIVSRATDDQMT